MASSALHVTALSALRYENLTALQLLSGHPPPMKFSTRSKQLITRFCITRQISAHCLPTGEEVLELFNVLNWHLKSDHGNDHDDDEHEEETTQDHSTADRAYILAIKLIAWIQANVHPKFLRPGLVEVEEGIGWRADWKVYTLDWCTGNFYAGPSNPELEMLMPGSRSVEVREGVSRPGISREKLAMQVGELVAQGKAGNEERKQGGDSQTSEHGLSEDGSVPCSEDEEERSLFEDDVQGGEERDEAVVSDRDASILAHADNEEAELSGDHPAQVDTRAQRISASAQTGGRSEKVDTKHHTNKPVDLPPTPPASPVRPTAPTILPHLTTTDLDRPHTWRLFTIESFLTTPPERSEDEEHVQQHTIRRQAKLPYIDWFLTHPCGPIIWPAGKNRGSLDAEKAIRPRHVWSRPYQT